MLVLVPGRSGIRIGAPSEVFFNYDSKAFFMMTTQGQSGEIWQDAEFHFFSVESHAQVMLFHSCHHSTTITAYICSVTINMLALYLSIVLSTSACMRPNTFKLLRLEILPAPRKKLSHLCLFRGVGRVELRWSRRP